MINRRLATRFTHLQVERVLRAESIAELLSAQVDRTLRKVLRLRQAADIADVLALLPQQLIGIADTAFRRMAFWSQREAVTALTDVLPRKWFRAVNPVTVLVGEELGDGDDDGFSLDDAIGPLAGERLTDEEWNAWVKQNVFPPPGEGVVRRIIETPVAGATWQERITGLSRLIQPETTSLLLSEGFADGKTVDQLAKDVLPHIDGNVRASAKRIARTEGLRVANTMQREMYEDLGDLMVGTQVLATLDEHTRPHHAMRNGTIYYNDRSRTPNVATLPSLPDEPNCRCFDVPVMKTPDAIASDPTLAAEFADVSGDAIPDPDMYDEWFSSVDESRRKLAVGSRRYTAVKEKLGREPEWRDFIDGEDGRLLSRKKLESESAEQRQKRRQAVQTLIDKRRQMLQDIRAAGFELPRAEPPKPRKKKKAAKKKPTVAKVKVVKKAARSAAAKASASAGRKAILDAIAKRSQKDREPMRRFFLDPVGEADVSGDRVDLVRRRMKKNANNAKKLRKEFLKKASILDPNIGEQWRELQIELDRTGSKTKQRKIRKEMDVLVKRYPSLADKGRAELLKIMKPEHGVSFELSGDIVSRAEAQEAQGFLQKILSLKHTGNPYYGDTKGNVLIKAAREDKRSHYDPADHMIHMSNDSDAGVWVHEAGHALEDSRDIHELCKGFLYHRVGREKAVSLDKEFPFQGYRENELGREDEFAKAYLRTDIDNRNEARRKALYVGKSYIGHTEILSMGSELLYNDPVGFAKSDPEWFDFTVGVLRGDLF